MAANMLWLVVVACSFISAGVVWLIGCLVSLSFCISKLYFYMSILPDITLFSQIPLPARVGAGVVLGWVGTLASPLVE